MGLRLKAEQAARARYSFEAIPKTGESLILRLTSKADLEAINSLFCDPRIYSTYQPQAAQSRAGKGMAWEEGDLRCSEDDMVRLTLVQHRDGAEPYVVGGAEVLDGQLSYFIDARTWGVGFGTALVRGVCFIAAERLGLRALSAEVLRINVASRRVLEKNNFVFCGLGRMSGRSQRERLSVSKFHRDLSLPT